MRRIGRFIVKFAYGDVIARKGIDLKSRELSTIAMNRAKEVFAKTG
ncbi:MAG: hypothetical protein WCT14_12295 [Treponemataceae bacterium]